MQAAAQEKNTQLVLKLRNGEGKSTAGGDYPEQLLWREVTLELDGF